MLTQHNTVKDTEIEKVMIMSHVECMRLAKHQPVTIMKTRAILLSQKRQKKRKKPTIMYTTMSLKRLPRRNLLEKYHLFQCRVLRRLFKRELRLRAQEDPYRRLLSLRHRHYHLMRNQNLEKPLLHESLLDQQNLRL